MIDMPPGWVPNDNASVDPHLECDLKEITSAFCPAADIIPKDVMDKVESISGLKCKVKITMQPQWGREMINPEVRDLMGL